MLKPIIAIVLLTAFASLAAGVSVEQREFDYVLKRTPDLQQGAELFETCAACHGPDGKGASDGSVPLIGGQRFEIIAKQLVDFRQDLRQDVRMQHFADATHLSYSQEVADVAAYASCLRPAESSTPVAAFDAEIRSGAKIYAARCERCHASDGVGRSGSLAPLLAGQHYEYLVKQLETAGSRPALTRAHAQLDASLKAEEIAQLARFLATRTPVPAGSVSPRNSLCTQSRPNGG